LILPSPTIIIAFIAGVILLIVLVLLNVKHKRSSAYRMNAMLSPYIKDEIKDVILPDGVGGLLEIEHLILMEQGIMLIETYPMEGNLFGAEAIELWSQIVEGRSYKFSNPLHHIHISRQAVQILAPKTPVFCRVIFNGNSAFPKGMPNEVSVLDSLTNDLLAIKSEKPRAIEEVWQQIKIIANNNRHNESR